MEGLDNTMEDKQLLAALQQEPILDLSGVISKCRQKIALYMIYWRGYLSLKEQHQLSTQLSPFEASHMSFTP